MSIEEKVLIAVRGNTHLLSGVAISEKREKIYLNVDQKALPDVGGLEGRFGFSSYGEDLRRGKIAKNDEIRVYSGFVNPDGSIAYSFVSYYAVDERTLNQGGEMTFDPKKVLQGVHWYGKSG